MTAEDVALGYKQLLEVERGWRDMSRSSTCDRSTTARKSASAPTSFSAGALLLARITANACGGT
jgi:hypothetical protein